jgi:hypothetical protein
MTIQVSSDALFESRLEVCKACDQYSSEAFDGKGQCMACGCPIQSKLRVIAVGCPLGKWEGQTEPVELSVPEPRPAHSPTITDMAKSFFSSAAKFVKAGLPRTPLDEVQLRLDTCRSCPYWDPEGFAGTGSCKECGCSTQVKLRMATSECPMGYWQAVPAHSEG